MRITSVITSGPQYSPDYRNSNVKSRAFDKEKFRSLFYETFKSMHLDASSGMNAEKMLDKLSKDNGITDRREMAYMLATALWETRVLKSKYVVVRDNNGNVVTDKSGKAKTRSVKTWGAMAPVKEADRGAGRRYFLPVKVKKLPGGRAQVTEQDGDQFIVEINGKYTPKKRGAVRGASPNVAMSQVYKDDDGEELAYYGRGLVQLTWWNNYAKAGAALGMSLELLFHPDLAEDEDIAYKLMSHGMVTGHGFANGRKLSDYFRGDHADYVGARAMVNGSDHAPEIAEMARKLQDILRRSEILPHSQSLNIPKLP
ncbi:hypothetical protein J5J86_03505 [Aquabacter sp. L1I39]|uniref:glycoside hydrolase family 19 protein n=1 Tax=Aquabacter sp. L1I39 TaxID=2820278 RepID=UPI001ADC71A9|nr:glycoside hydrolase family 19 protein [Aquabacter sp. L1I39]QTL04421.1 hypothetical protein J5J86_03505 [Aquabacter sp. L1I39]